MQALIVPLGQLTSDCRFVLVSVRTSDTEGSFVAQPDTATNNNPNNKRNITALIN
tara:strand:+ start:3851 stop:4015 length:165 start_codon:yes stop_codon:yes gene_type:complete